MDISPEAAEAIHKTKNAQQAIEAAREAQLAQAVADTARQTKESLLEALQEVFGGGDSEDPQQMRILIRRVPILCVNIEQMHQDIAAMKDIINWAVKIVVGAVLVGLTGIFVTAIVNFIT